MIHSQNYKPFNDKVFENSKRELKLASKRGDVKLVKLLLENGTKINKGSLFEAAKKGHTKVVKTLLIYGVQIENYNRKGCNALHIAAKKDNQGVVKILLKNGANIEACNNEGLTALQIAAHNGHKKTIKVFCKYASNLFHAEENIRSAHEMARIQGHNSICKIFETLLKISSQSWIIHPMLQLKYNINKNGVCTGYSLMGIQAILSGELNLFKKRIKKIQALNCLRFRANINMLTKKEKKDRVDIHAFFNGITLHMCAITCSNFLKKSVVGITKALPLSILSPCKLDNVNGITLVDLFSGLYTQDELVVYLHYFKKIFKQMNLPLALELIYNNHSICISYDLKNDNWILIDANICEVKILKEDVGLRNAIFQSMNCNLPHLSLLTTVFSCANQKNITNDAIKTWKSCEPIEKIREVTSEKNCSLWLPIATGCGEFELITKLLLLNGNNEIINNSFSLHHASAAGNDLIFKFLLEKGANVNGVESLGQTPLCVASYYKKLSILKILLENDANINVRDSDGNNVLSWASISGSYEIVELLLQKGANVKNENKFGCTSLHIAAIQGHISIVELLINKGAEIEACTHNGENALHLAAENGNFDTVKLLIKYGIDSSKLNDYDESASDLASQNGHHAISAFLLTNIACSVPETAN